jgi:hypothetical protein
MSLAPICILYCKNCNTMNEYRICWFSRFAFPGEKFMCNVCIFHCIFYVPFLNLHLVSEIYWLQGDTFVVKGLARDCDKPCYSGRSTVLFFQVKRNGKKFKDGDREV